MLLIEETFIKYGYRINDGKSKYSKKIIIIRCDYCGDMVEKTVSNFYIQRKNLNKDCCNKKECKSNKLSESKLKMSNVPEGHRKCPHCNVIKPLNEDNFNRDGHDKYKYKCRDCSKNYYHENKTLKTEKVFTLDETIDLYNKSLNNKNVILPPKFFERIEDLNGFIDYVFKEKTNEYFNLFKNVNAKFINEFNLIYLMRKHKSIFNFINHFYPDYIMPWQLKKSPQGFWNNDSNVIKALNWLVKQFYEDGLISNISDIPKIITYKLCAKYSLGGLIANRFNSSVYHAIDFLYPNKFKIFQFNVPPQYYNKKENRTYITNKFIEKLFEDHIISNIDDIPSKINIYTFDKYGLKGYLTHVYKGITFAAFDEVFPGKWNVWEFKSAPAGYWENEANIKKAIIWLVDKLKTNGIINEVSDLQYLQLYKLLDEYSLRSLTKDSVKMHQYFINTYPDELSQCDFNLNVAKDGTRCLSKAEVVIHNLFLDMGMLFDYGSKKYRFKNNKYNESYMPDWVLKTKDKDIIVEYFGLYTENAKDEFLLNYKQKTHRKIDYYTNLTDYSFLALYPKDLQANYKGLINKLRLHKIEMSF